MVLAAAAVERAMKVQEVILRAMSGAITWLQAADILGIHTRSLRRSAMRSGCQPTTSWSGASKIC